MFFPVFLNFPVSSFSFKLAGLFRFIVSMVDLRDNYCLL